MDIIAISDVGLGNRSYVIDVGGGAALVVDPPRVVAPHLAAAREHDLTIRFVAETHLHADFVSGGRELVSDGLRLLVPAAGGYAFDRRGLSDGDEVDLGGLTLQSIATPGHTPEHLAFLLCDGTTPVALFSGGTLMAGGVARPDLIAPEHTEQLARAAWRSITGPLLTLPDELLVYPTHGGGSFCAPAGGTSETTTIGEQRRTNPLLNAVDEDDFVARLLGGLGSYPPYFLHLREVNRRGPALVGPDRPALARLTPDQVTQAVGDGAIVIDARPIAGFAAGHLPASISIELRPQFASWLGWTVPFGTPVVVVMDEDQDEAELVAQALTIGYDQVLGRLDGGVPAWHADGRAVAMIPLLGPGDDRDGRQLVDVRQASEWKAGHVPGSLHAEAGSVVADLADLDGDVVTHCGHGQRAMTAASLLMRAGHTGVAVTSLGPDELTAIGWGP